MNDKEEIMGLVRHLMTVIGGYLISKGLASPEQMTEIYGLIIASSGIIWSVLSKIKVRKVIDGYEVEILTIQAQNKLHLDAMAQTYSKSEVNRVG